MTNVKGFQLFMTWVLILGFVCLFFLMMLKEADARSSILLADTQASNLTTACTTKSETVTNYQQVIIEHDAQISEVVVALKKSSSSDTGSFTIAILVNDELKYFTFGDLVSLSTSFTDQVYPISDTFVLAGDDIKIYLTPLGTINGALLIAGNNSGYSGTTECNSFSTSLDWYMRVYGYLVPHKSWLLPLIPFAYASTSCTFVQNQATTTAECDDSHIINTSSDIFNGLILFFVVFFGLIYFFFRK